MAMHQVVIGAHATAYDPWPATRFVAICVCGWRGSDCLERKEALGQAANHRRTMRAEATCR